MKLLIRIKYFLRISQGGGENFSTNQDSIAAAFISDLSCLNFKLLSWLLQCFRHIQSKDKDAKLAVSIFFKSKTAICFTRTIWQLRHRKG